jgi:hypothetical protein
VVARAEVGFARLEDVELAAFLEMRDQLLGIGAPGFGDRVQDDPRAGVVVARLVLRRIPEPGPEALREIL